MGEYAGGGGGSTTVVEDLLHDVLREALPSTGGPFSGVSMTVGTLSWNAIRLDGEGNLPPATVTWPGHGLTTEARSTSPAQRASTADRGPEDANADISVDGDGLVGREARTQDGGLIDGDGLVGGDASPVVPVTLDQLPVGAGLVAQLSGVEVADLTDDVLLDVAARWQDVISWATAMQSRALGEIARRRSWTEEHTAAAAEISARLRIPQREANKHLARGAGLAEHPQVMNALHDGLIDTAKADILLRSGNPLTHEERDEAITRYLPQAPDRTRGWLRDKMNAFANHLKGTLETAKHARTRRAVYLDPADNTMAWITANLPAPDAAAVWDAIEQAAHALRRAPGTTRTLAQARADALVAITTGRLVVPPDPECTPADPADGTGVATSATTETTATALTAGTTAGAAATAGTTATAGASVAETSPEEALPRTTVPATGCTCGGCTCGGTAIRVIPVKPQIRITIPASTLLGLDNAPGHLDGYGPIPADIAAQIATDATWQRLLTDPSTGILTDHSTTTYQPGKLLRQAVTARDRTCTFLQCERPGRWADLDHIRPFDHDIDLTAQPPGTPGQTRATNLHALCRAHHLAKTHHGWTPVRDPATGITTWTAPTGHTYTRPPTQTGQVSNDLTSLTDDTRARLGQPPRDNTDNTPPTTNASTTEPSAIKPTTKGAPTAPSPAAQPAVEQLTTEQRLRRFPDEPPF